MRMQTNEAICALIAYACLLISPLNRRQSSPDLDLKHTRRHKIRRACLIKRDLRLVRYHVYASDLAQTVINSRRVGWKSMPNNGAQGAKWEPACVDRAIAPAIGTLCRARRQAR